jgi:hypothetical protein
MVEELWRILRRSHREEIKKTTQGRMNQVVPFNIAEDIVDNDPGIGHKFLCSSSFLRDP